MGNECFRHLSRWLRTATASVTTNTRTRTITTKKIETICRHSKLVPRIRQQVHLFPDHRSFPASLHSVTLACAILPKMLFFLRHSSGYELRRTGNAIGAGLLSLGLLSLLFGIAVFAAPQLLAYIVASFFVIVGLSMIATWWRLRH